MTREKWAAMTVDERWIKVAELCGYTNVSPAVPEDRFGAGHEPPMVGHYPESKSRGLRHPVPDYLTSLDAMHEAEKRLGNQPGLSDRIIYVEWLEEICNETQSCMQVFATAAQRAEAFVLTMERE